MNINKQIRASRVILFYDLFVAALWMDIFVYLHPNLLFLKYGCTGINNWPLIIIISRNMFYRLSSDVYTCY